MESSTLEGWVGVMAADVGTPTTGCGGFTFDMTFPIPPGVVCSSQFPPCGPSCRGEGELGLCTPAHPKVRYRAIPGAPCVSTLPTVGAWQLALTSVCPNPVADTLITFETHGHLTATLVNDADPADSVELNLAF